ncbi:MAG: hypothetical protein RL376_1496 [Verrucomicrobiota bacterium]|jgi:hypothetical protein
MNEKQLTLYWREWRACSLALKALGRECDDVVRKALQADAIGGIDKSSKKLTNAELTRVLAKFRSWSKADDLNAQMHAENEPGERRAAALKQIEQLGADCGLRGGLAGVSTYFKKWLNGKAVGMCDDDTLRKLVFLLKRRKEQGGIPDRRSPAAAAKQGGGKPVATSVPAPSQEEPTPEWDGVF